MLSRKIPEFCSVDGARSKTAFFAFLGYPSTILRTAYRKQFYPKSMLPMESRDSEGVLFLVWRISDQAFSRYRHEKWSSGHDEF